MSDPIPAEGRPHRVSALTGFDSAGEDLDPRNLPQGAGRPDDDAHAERVAASQEAEAERAAAVRGDAEPVHYSYEAGDVPESAADVVQWIHGADDDADRAARADAAEAVELARPGGTRKTVTDELER